MPSSVLRAKLLMMVVRAGMLMPAAKVPAQQRDRHEQHTGYHTYGYIKLHRPSAAIQ